MARRNHELSIKYQSREDKWSDSSLITDYCLKLRKIQENSSLPSGTHLKLFKIIATVADVKKGAVCRNSTLLQFIHVPVMSSGVV